MRAPTSEYAAARRPDRPAAGHRNPVRAYLRQRFPLPLMAVTVLLGLAGVLPYPTRSVVTLLVAAIGPTVLFLGQRLVDDIDDFRRDSARGAVPAGVTRRGMTLAYAALLLAITGLSLPDPTAACVGVGALAAMWLGPLAARSALGRIKPVLFVLYESIPFAIVVYPAIRSDAPLSGVRSGPVALALVLWCGYEFWKFSRKIDDCTYTPFGLGLPGRLWVSALLAVAAAAVAVLAGVSGVLPWAVAGAAATAAAPFAVLSADRGARTVARPTAVWSGLPVLVVVPAAVVLAALLTT